MRASVFGIIACVMFLIMGTLIYLSPVVQIQLAGTIFMPHGNCFLWDPLTLSLMVIGDSLLTLTYMVIPGTLLFVALKDKGINPIAKEIILLFSGFILLCGFTHAMSIYNLWNASYLAEGVLSICAGIFSTWVAIRVLILLPRWRIALNRDKRDVQIILQVLQHASIIRPDNIEEFQREVKAATKRLQQLNILNLIEVEEKTIGSGYDMHQG